MKLPNRWLWVLLVVLFGLVLPLCVALGDLPDVSVVSRPLRTHGGAIPSAAPPGQVFYCSEAGLRQLDVALVSVRPISTELELVVRADGPEGEVLRSCKAQPGQLREPAFVPFQFEPILDSKDRWFHFQLQIDDELATASYATWIRFHGQTGRDDPWGSEKLDVRSVQSYFQSPLGDLRAVAVACEHLSTKSGPVKFEIWDLDDGGKTRRKLDWPAPAWVQNGYAFFSFQPIANSKGRNYGYRIDSAGPAEFNGRFGKPALKTLHGLDGETPGVRGMTSGMIRHPDRDLSFRSWSASGVAHGVSTAETRAGWRIWVAVSAWLLSILALARLLFRSEIPSVNGSAAAIKKTA